MTADPERRIANRREIIATLRRHAAALEAEAADARARADRLEVSTNALEAGQ